MVIRKGMAASDLLFGVVIFFGVIAGLSLFVTDISTNYGYTSPQLDKYNNLSGVQSLVSSMGFVVGNSTVSDSGTNYFFISAGSIWGAFKFFFQVPGYILAILANASADLGLPLFVVPLVAILTLLTIMMTAISSAMRKDV
jgi:hypothetical protein